MLMYLQASKLSLCIEHLWRMGQSPVSDQQNYFFSYQTGSKGILLRIMHDLLHASATFAASVNRFYSKQFHKYTHGCQETFNDAQRSSLNLQGSIWQVHGH